jgi:inhibitor of cysteine peptidase
MAEIRLDAQDATRLVEAAAGDRLIVTLPESPSTGQSWFAESSDPAVLQPDGEDFDRVGALIPGGVGTRRFLFLAGRVGDATLSLQLAYPATGTAAQSLSIQVVVR